MNSNSYDIWDVNSTANKLIGKAHTISARHIKNASTRMQFNREVSYYAKRIADDVALGHKTPEQGIQTIFLITRSSKAHWGSPVVAWYTAGRRPVRQIRSPDMPRTWKGLPRLPNTSSTVVGSGPPSEH